MCLRTYRNTCTCQNLYTHMRTHTLFCQALSAREEEKIAQIALQKRFDTLMSECDSLRFDVGEVQRDKQCHSSLHARAAFAGSWTFVLFLVHRISLLTVVHNFALDGKSKNPTRAKTKCSTVGRVPYLWPAVARCQPWMTTHMIRQIGSCLRYNYARAHTQNIVCSWLHYTHTYMPNAITYPHTDQRACNAATTARLSKAEVSACHTPWQMLKLIRLRPTCDTLTPGYMQSMNERYRLRQERFDENLEQLKILTEVRGAGVLWSVW